MTELIKVTGANANIHARPALILLVESLVETTRMDNFLMKWATTSCPYRNPIHMIQWMLDKIFSLTVRLEFKNNCIYLFDCREFAIHESDLTKDETTIHKFLIANWDCVFDKAQSRNRYCSEMHLGRMHPHLVDCMFDADIDKCIFKRPELAARFLAILLREARGFDSKIVGSCFLLMCEIVTVAVTNFYARNKDKIPLPHLTLLFEVIHKGTFSIIRGWNPTVTFLP
jgi:hypothetical protein